ncbi:bifunctional lysylphosphatidylglycerol flippase/synthetase MprF [Novosphingobium sp. JCM 18896]|uniref:bifunctional lysylphosphatidylglycerol flippase/synthetase MprF n=1 Tax=Novosphingobium sp. JCM 18896 TaxID=2989731 RepID=UPI002222C243|nr:bifunctional lysylphosphatidylglycerol flippase/synthetase MprF [Novosphingobium sp. JCM 18896]MCW1430186.1 bifunctional lysylphosphatidylglycerol flippase/synthetase MprF [Novosphingobium sp. JCM 18896]
MGLLIRHRRSLELLAVLAVGLLTVAALHGLVQDVHLAEVRHALAGLTGRQIAAAIGFTAISYGLLTLYDVLALRIIGRPLPYRTAALASLTSYTLSHNLGFALLTGGSARYRIYTAAGLGPTDIVRVIAVASVTFWSGVVTMAAAALLLHPTTLTLAGWTLDPMIQRSLGAVLLGLILAAIVWIGRGRGTIALWHWSFPRPSARQAAAQPLLAALDLAAASAALYVLVGSATPDQFPAFFLGYALAMIVALLSHLPGGIGVFEAVMVAALPGADPASLLAALILYRVVYYLLPLAIAVILLGLHERRRLRAPLNAVQMVLRGISPAFLATMAFLGGGVLLISGSLPAIPARLHALRHVLPLPFVEASHIAASLAGTGLLLLAPALFRRVDAAFILTRALLLAGAGFSLAKGFDYEEAAILLVMAGVLQMARPAFYRHTVLSAALRRPGPIAAVAICLALTVWIGFFAYRHVDYQSNLWWEFAWNGDASRFLRATFGVAVMLVCFGATWLFGHARPHASPADMDMGASAAAIARSPRSEALLALTGDKRFLRSPSGEAVLMYQVQGQSWIVMGDPLGPKAEWADLLWRIREMADQAQGRLLLYQIGIEAMPIAVDLGLQLLKYGEEARVALPGFTLEGAAMRDLRHAERRAEREGGSFAIVAAAEVPLLMDELRALSDGWLAIKGQSEKAFSVGRFDPDYIARFDCAVVRQAGRIVAFANIWATSDREELSVDLMRHAETMPYGTMDYLFVQLMKWGKEQGFRWFNLGLAPLSGIEARRLAPIWARVGGLIYRHAGAFYRFAGLRAYKEKFGPVWSPRYIAAPHGLGLARALIDLQTLVGGGRLSAARPRRRQTSPRRTASRVASARLDMPSF